PGSIRRGLRFGAAVRNDDLLARGGERAQHGGEMRVTALALRELDADDGRAERLRMRDPLCRPHDLAVGSRHAALRERELQRTRLRQRLERRRWPSPWIRCDLDRGALVDAVRNSFEEAVEPRAHLECDVRELIRWIFRGRVTEVADVETLRAA